MTGNGTGSPKWHMMMKISKAVRRDKKRKKRRHGMRVDRRPTDIGRALEKRARKEEK